MSSRRPARCSFGARFVLASVVASGALVAFFGFVQLACITATPRARVAVGRAALRDRHGGLLVDARDTASHAYEPAAASIGESLVAKAFVASEDRRLGHHGGVDLWAIGRATVTSVRAGRVTSGASTMAMQLVRLREGRRPGVHAWHKLRDLVLAVRLTRELGADGVLRAYLDEVPLGPHVIGVDAAARRAFGKSAETLDVSEASILAVFARAPASAVRAAQSAAVRWRIEHRARRVLDELVRRGVASVEARKALPLVVASLVGERSRGLDAPVAARFAREGAAVSSLDPVLERTLHGALRDGLTRVADRGVSHGAALLVELGSMQVRAVSSQATGSTTWLDGTLARRQPGSTLKPFLVAAALETLGASSVSVQDAPMGFAGEDDVFEPRNYDGRFHGEVPLDDVLARSLNIPTLRLVARVGVAPFLQRLRASGFASLDASPGSYGANLALGDGEVTLTELVEAYSALANDGAHAALCWRERAECPHGSAQVYERDVARIVTRMLDDDRARSPSFERDGVFAAPYPLAVKTGTSREHRDSWAIAYGRRYLVGVWMGRADGGATREVNGARGPGPVVRSVLDALEVAGDPFPLPEASRWGDERTCLDAYEVRAGHPACGRERMVYRRAHAPSGDVQPTRIGRDSSESAWFVFPTEGASFVVDGTRAASAQGLRVLVGASEGHGLLTVRDGALRTAVEAGRAVSLPLTVGAHRLELVVGDRVVDRRAVFVAPVDGDEP